MLVVVLSVLFVLDILILIVALNLLRKTVGKNLKWSLIIAGITFMIFVPAVMAFLMKKVPIFSVAPGGIEEWIPFWGSYLGGILAFIGVYITIRVQIKYSEDERKEEIERFKKEQKRKQEQHEQQIESFTQFRKNSDKKVMLSYLRELDYLRSKVTRQHVLFLEEFHKDQCFTMNFKREMNSKSRELEHMTEEYQFLYMIILNLLLLEGVALTEEGNEDIFGYKKFAKDINDVRNYYLDIMYGKESYYLIQYIRDMEYLGDLSKKEGQKLERLMNVVIKL